MNYGRQPKWYSGQFLESQHLQYLTNHVAQLQGEALKIVPNETWGFARLDLDNSLLQAGTLRIKEMTAVTQDGTFLEFPGNCKVPDLQFSDQWTDSSRPLEVYLGLRRYNPSAPNVAAGSNGGRSGNSAPLELLDFNDADRSVKVDLIEYNIRLFTNYDVDAASDYELLHVARLVMDDSVVQHDPQFSFPSSNLRCSDVLESLAQEFYQKVMATARGLEEIKNTFNGSSMEYGRREARLMAGMQALSECTASMRHQMSNPFVHPAALFEAVNILISRLSTFSDLIDLTGSYRGGSSELLNYDHGNPAACFRRALDLIPILLDELTPTAKLVVPFVAVGGERLYTEIPSHFFGDNVDFFLMVESSDEENSWVPGFQSNVRIAAESEMKDLIRFSLSGLPCQFSPSRPAGAPIREKAFFFKLNTDSKVWRTIANERDIGIEWKNIPAEVSVELVAVQK